MLSRYEHGRQYPSLPSLVKILRALDCTAEDFGNRLGPWDACMLPGVPVRVELLEELAEEQAGRVEALIPPGRGP